MYRTSLKLTEEWEMECEKEIGGWWWMGNKPPMATMLGCCQDDHIQNTWKLLHTLEEDFFATVVNRLRFIVIDLHHPELHEIHNCSLKSSRPQREQQNLMLLRWNGLRLADYGNSIAGASVVLPCLAPVPPQLVRAEDLKFRDNL